MAGAKVTSYGLVFWLIVARISLFVGLAGIVPWLFPMSCLLIVGYPGEYSDVALVYFLLFWTLVKPWSLVVPLLVFPEAVAITVFFAAAGGGDAGWLFG